MMSDNDANNTQKYRTRDWKAFMLTVNNHVCACDCEK